MDLWSALGWFRLVSAHMQHFDECLYNAFVIKMHRQPREYLLRVRDSLLDWAKMIEEEIQSREQ